MSFPNVPLNLLVCLILGFVLTECSEAEKLYSIAGFCKELEDYERQKAAGSTPYQSPAETCDRQAGTHRNPNKLGIHKGVIEIDHEIAIPACRIAASNEPHNSRIEYQLARALFAKAHIPVLDREKEDKGARFYRSDPAFLEAMEILQKLSDENHANAMAFIGALRNDEELIAKAGTLGSPLALGYNLKQCLMRERSFIKCWAVALKASEAGDTEAINELVVRYSHQMALGASGPESQIINMLERAATRSSNWSIATLVSVYNPSGPTELIRGLPFRPDRKRFEHWLVFAFKTGRDIGDTVPLNTILQGEIEKLGSEYVRCGTSAE